MKITIKKMKDAELKELENNLVRRLIELKYSDVEWKDRETKTLEAKLVEVLDEQDKRSSK